MPGAFLHPFAPPARDHYVSIVRGEGAIVWDAAGRRLVDAFASLWYGNIGHGRREIADAVAEQIVTLDAFNTFDRWTNPAADRLCERLAALAPVQGSRVFLVGSGSEAVDSALKLARAAQIRAGHPERVLVLSREYAYHGVTYGGTSAQGLAGNREGFGPLLPEVEQVPHDDLAAMTARFDERPGEVAAVIAEPVIGAGGVRPPPPGYLEGLRALCDRHGAYLILDEVICAFGRLGHWWGADRFRIRPDLQTFAKGVTSGYLPLGGVVCAPSVLAPLEADPDWVLRTGHTYSGHPVCCVAASANIDVIEREGLLGRADDLAARLGPALAGLVDRGLGVEARGDGGMWAIDVADGVDAARVTDAMIERGVIGRNLGPDTFALCPPLVIDDDDLDLVVSALGDSLESLS